MHSAADLAAAPGEFSREALERSLSEGDRLLLHQILSPVSNVVSLDEARNCLGALSIRLLEKRRQEVQEAIRKAEAEGELPHLKALIEERRTLEHKIKHYS